jgi:hypothetical protein
MIFRSILFEDVGGVGDPQEPPEVLHDLGLDAIIDAIAASRRDDDLTPLFRSRPTREATVVYRQAIMRDLDTPAIAETIAAFCDALGTARRRLTLSTQAYYPLSGRRWLLDAMDTYCEAVRRLRQGLHDTTPRSSGLRALSNYVDDYCASDPFTTLASDVRDLCQSLSAIQVGLVLHDGSVTVRGYEGEPDYSAVVADFFAKFRQRAGGGRRTNPRPSSGMTHVEAGILHRVARLHPTVFAVLEDFAARHANAFDETLVTFEREVQFYLAYREYIAPLRAARLPFCYPTVSTTSKHESSRQGFDLALARQLVGRHVPVVGNDYHLDGPERLIVVTGPNQGGKTTFARTVGQLHYLASLGCPVPGEEARLLLCDRIFTHFERAEDVETASGKLRDDLVRMRAVLDAATPASLIILNETFASTTVRDALVASRRIMTRLSELDALTVSVTFLDELANFDAKTVSMVALMDADDPDRRTFHVERRPADGVSYALAVARRHGLTYDQLKERLPR